MHLLDKIVALLPRKELEALFDSHDKPWHWNRKHLDLMVRSRMKQSESNFDEVLDIIQKHIGKEYIKRDLQ